jgi:hypothetical protein
VRFFEKRKLVYQRKRRKTKRSQLWPIEAVPLWDPLRGDPRFEKIVEEAKQPVDRLAELSGAR